MICVSISYNDYDKCLKTLHNAEMAEIRADLCELSETEIASLIKGTRGNVIITCRIAGTSIKKAKSMLCAGINAGAGYVDIETEAPDEFVSEIRGLAAAKGCRLIISHHDFEKTPSLTDMEEIARDCLSKGAEIIKIVTTANNTEEAVRTLALYKSKNLKDMLSGCGKNKNAGLVAFSMGEKGKFTRYTSLLMGSPFSYAAPEEGKNTAPGQFTRKQLENLFKEGKFVFKHPVIKNKVSIPSSKSIAQRAIVASALAKGVSLLKNYSPCGDSEAALNLIKSLGCEIKKEGSSEKDKYTITIQSPGATKLQAGETLFTGESGFLTRLIIPVACALYGKPVSINGTGSLKNRKLEETSDALRNAGVKFTCDSDHLPFKILSGITNNEISLNGRSSSQIISGFLYAMPLLGSGSVIRVKNASSLPYIFMTLSVLKKYGIIFGDTETSEVLNKIKKGLDIKISGKGKYEPCNIFLETDWSSAACFTVAQAISKSLNMPSFIIEGLTDDKTQADGAILDVIKACGPELKNFNFDATDCPDLFPALTVLACFCHGKSRIKGVDRLYEKESNRAEAIYTEFTALGADIDIKDDIMYIKGGELHGGNVHCHNDHRMAMSLITASCFINEPVYLDNIYCINKSFASFLDNFLILRNKTTKQK
ncbi:MAG: type I 3-dehydroquinate dehydratase [Bacteroidales bacterium]|jgi:3-phosphoshikimate 1-carboxyvinyltransferase|nr:type I 3-dehydroquinate dehydratase [Bacteroidales bacterium]